MIGAILGLAMSAASTAIGAARNAQTARKQQQNIDADEAANEAYRNRYMNEDPLARAGNRRLMEQQMRNVERLNRAAAGTQAVVGGTDESVAAQRENNSNALANTAGQIAASQDARRDAVENQYMANRQVISNDKNNLYTTRANNMAAAVQAAGQTAASVATSLDGSMGGKTTSNAPKTKVVETETTDTPIETKVEIPEKFAGEKRVQSTINQPLKMKTSDQQNTPATPFSKPLKSLEETSGDAKKWNRLNDNINQIKVGRHVRTNEDIFEDWDEYSR